MDGCLESSSKRLCFFMSAFLFFLPAHLHFRYHKLCSLVCRYCPRSHTHVISPLDGLNREYFPRSLFTLVLAVSFYESSTLDVQVSNYAARGEALRFYSTVTQVRKSVLSISRIPSWDPSPTPFRCRTCRRKPGPAFVSIPLLFSFDVFASMLRVSGPPVGL